MIDRYAIYNVESLRDAVEASEEKTCDNFVTVADI